MFGTPPRRTHRHHLQPRGRADSPAEASRSADAPTCCVSRASRREVVALELVRELPLASPAVSARLPLADGCGDIELRLDAVPTLLNADLPGTKCALPLEEIGLAWLSASRVTGSQRLGRNHPTASPH